MEAARPVDAVVGTKPPADTPPPAENPPESDVPVFGAVRTVDVDEARAFCRGMYHYPMWMRPVGSAAGFAFSGEVVRLGPITIGEVGYGSNVIVHSADLEKAYHVLTPLSGLVQARHRDRVLTASPRRAAVLRPVGETELTVPQGCRVLGVRIDRMALEQEVATAWGRYSVGPLPLGPSFDITAGPGRSWASLVRLLHAELHHPQSLVRQPVMARRWWQLVLSGLALTVELPYRDDLVSGSTALRPRSVKRTLDAMHAAPGHQFTAVELAGIAGVGVRVLQESFRRHIGMPPMTYLRELRLARVHDELTNADPGQVSVSEVAVRWGFTHLGRFAGAYRDRYGVAPSRTLHQRR